MTSTRKPTPPLNRLWWNEARKCWNELHMMKNFSTWKRAYIRSMFVGSKWHVFSLDGHMYVNFFDNEFAYRIRPPVDKLVMWFIEQNKLVIVRPDKLETTQEFDDTMIVREALRLCVEHLDELQDPKKRMTLADFINLAAHSLATKGPRPCACGPATVGLQDRFCGACGGQYSFSCDEGEQ